jgi:ElaA protein
LVIKRFEELTVQELYEILKIRVAVFVVEQNCPYQEIDGKDTSSLHVFLREGGAIKAYLRVVPKGVTFEDVVSIGRVLTTERGKGYGGRILLEGIKAARELLGGDTLKIEAQTYAKGYYEKAGFRQSSEEFMEDGIPHIEMTLR